MNRKNIRENVQCITRPENLPEKLRKDIKGMAKVAKLYPMKITPYFLSLIKKPFDPLWNQVIPQQAELSDNLNADPLCEEVQSPLQGLIHRYPDRVVFLVSSRCAIYCRHCMRKRKTGNNDFVTEKTIKKGIDYIRKNEEIRDVILSGGDPFLLSDEKLSEILEKLRKINHVEIIRIHTRVPSALPFRITKNLGNMLKKFHPLYVNIQFNHPDEITPVSEKACSLLADSGIPLGCQSVLLKGVNDHAEVIKKLMTKLLKIRVRPYYIHQADLVRGTSHFHTPVETGLKIMDALRGHISGMGVPYFMIDLPGGGGKIPLLPEYIVEKKTGIWKIRSFDGKIIDYPVLSP